MGLLRFRDISLNRKIDLDQNTQIKEAIISGFVCVSSRIQFIL